MFLNVEIKLKFKNQVTNPRNQSRLNRQTFLKKGSKKINKEIQRSTDFYLI
jgi:hypothetical protein